MKEKTSGCETAPFAEIWPEYSGSDQSMAQATEYVRSRIPAALRDPGRPRCHFVPPAQAMIDVWGGMCFHGSHRLFYDLNLLPENRMGGSFMQLESDDLVHWRQLPVALMPSAKRGELRLNDGCVLIRRDGTPLMYYTSVFFDESLPREHVPVLGSPDMRHWNRLEDKAITLENHGGPRYHGNWSDIFFFEEAGRTFMIVSKCVTADGEAQIPIYEAVDASCLDWKYRGVFFENNGEVLNFIQVGGKWVLIYCPYEKPVWHIGSFDSDKCRFVPEKSGVLSYGYRQQGDVDTLMARGFYATSAFHDRNGSPVILGWMSGFRSAAGWDGCISFPRTLSIADDGVLCMMPSPAVTTLRESEQTIFCGESRLRTGPLFDLEMTFDENVAIDGNGIFSLRIDARNAVCNGIRIPLEKPLSKLRLLADVSVVELFFEDGRICFAEAVPPMGGDFTWNVTGTGIAGWFYRLESLNEQFANDLP